jgi:hypothetical protein
MPEVLPRARAIRELARYKQPLLELRELSHWDEPKRIGSVTMMSTDGARERLSTPVGTADQLAPGDFTRAAQFGGPGPAVP